MSKCTRLGGDAGFGSPTAAFSLTELLVMIVVLGLLAATQLPALTRAKAPVKQIQCMNNLRQLSFAWRIYADDNNDQLVNNFGLTWTLTTISDGTMENWANNYMDWSTDPVNTNLTLLKTGKLTPYLGGNVGAFKCPADRFLSAGQRAAGFTARARSVAMNGFLGPYGYRNAPKNYYSGRNNSFPEYRQWLTFAEIARPAAVFVFAEEHPDPIIEGLFINDPRLDAQGVALGTKWADAPASFHSGGANLTFADGHNETYYWKSGKTKFPVTTAISGSASCPNFAGDASATRDLTWMVQRQSVLYPNY